MNPTNDQIRDQAEGAAEIDQPLHALFGGDDALAELERMSGEHGDEGAPSGYHPIFYTLLFRC